ncbi:MAG: YeeE/YedE family protein [Gammaproteobacteria bacterium]|nr:YeeE/YedE family protein [Gammaproteobacteria bacterium]
MTEFTPYSALGGGLLIGLSAALLWLFNGRIAGISGIVGGLFQPGDRPWRWAFIAGLPLGAWLMLQAWPTGSQITVEAGPVQLIVAGLLVGYGSRLGSGCTSGHGVCGLGRFSLRSLVATITFLTTGMVSVFLLRHLGG